MTGLSDSAASLWPQGLDVSDDTVGLDGGGGGGGGGGLVSLWILLTYDSYKKYFYQNCFDSSMLLKVYILNNHHVTIQPFMAPTNESQKPSKVGLNSDSDSDSEEDLPLDSQYDTTNDGVFETQKEAFNPLDDDDNDDAAFSLASPPSDKPLTRRPLAPYSVPKVVAKPLIKTAIPTLKPFNSQMFFLSPPVKVSSQTPRNASAAFTAPSNTMLSSEQSQNTMKSDLDTPHKSSLISSQSPRAKSPENTERQSPEGIERQSLSKSPGKIQLQSGSEHNTSDPHSKATATAPSNTLSTPPTTPSITAPVRVDNVGVGNESDSSSEDDLPLDEVTYSPPLPIAPLVIKEQEPSPNPIITKPLPSNPVERSPPLPSQLPKAFELSADLEDWLAHSTPPPTITPQTKKTQHFYLSQLSQRSQTALSQDSVLNRTPPLACCNPQNWQPVASPATSRARSYLTPQSTPFARRLPAKTPVRASPEISIADADKRM